MKFLTREKIRDEVKRWFDESREAQAEVARATGINADFISKILAGTREIKADELFNLWVYFTEKYPYIEPGFIDFTTENKQRELSYVSEEEEWQQERAALSRERRHNLPAGEIPQVEGTIGLGNRSDVEVINIDVGNGLTISGAPVVGTWKMPLSVLQRRVSAAPDHLHFIECEGNSMEPIIKDGDVVLIDQSKKNPNMPGIFALWEDGGQTIKQVQMVRGSDPLRYRLIPANPTYAQYERLASDVQIIGRYAARFTVD